MSISALTTAVGLSLFGRTAAVEELVLLVCHYSFCAEDLSIGTPNTCSGTVKLEKIPDFMRDYRDGGFDNELLDIIKIIEDGIAPPKPAPFEEEVSEGTQQDKGEGTLETVLARAARLSAGLAELGPDGNPRVV